MLEFQAVKFAKNGSKNNKCFHHFLLGLLGFRTMGCMGIPTASDARFDSIPEACSDFSRCNFRGEHVECFNGFSGGDFWSRKLFVDSTTYVIDISQFKSSSTQIDMLSVRTGKIPTRS